jgi:Mg-chelatase subunit ChlD
MRIVLLVDSSGSVAPQLEHFRAGLSAFVDALPIDDEVALLSFAGQLRIRLQPTTDRQKLRSTIASFVSDGGPNSFVDALFEADKRLLKNAPTSWPVFVIVTADPGDSRMDPRIEEFNDFVKDFTARGGSAHAVAIKGTKAGLISELAMNFSQNTGGIYEPLAIANALPDKMKAIAARIAADRKAMSTRYELEYGADPKAAMQPVEIRLKREGATIQLSSRRPF